MGLANVTEESEEPHAGEYSDEEIKDITENHFPKLEKRNLDELKRLGFSDDKIEHSKWHFPLKI